MLSFNFSSAALARDLQRTAERVEAAQEKALDRAAQVTLNAKARTVSRTYKRAIPRGKKGAPKWKRTGAWQAGQSIGSRPGERIIETTGAAAQYESRLATLPRSKDGVNRRNAAAEDAFAIVEPQLGPVFDAEIRAALR